MSIEFYYKAINKKGVVVDGTRRTTDDLTLNKELAVEGLNLIFAEPADKSPVKKFFKQLKDFGTVGEYDKILTYKNLAAMLDSGLPLSRAITVLAKQSKNKMLKKALTDINKEVRKGESLSDAMANHPKIFVPLVVSMVRAGEASGDLVQSLQVTASQLEKTYNLRKKIIGAMVYPAVIISATFLLGIFMLVYVVPTLTGTFEELGVDLPASTQFVIDLSEFTQNNLALVFFTIVLLIVLLIAFLKSKKGKHLWNTVLRYIPKISELNKEINSARTTRTLSSLLQAGVPFVKALQITREVVQNAYYQEVIKQAEKNIKIGKPISEIFIKSDKLFPVFVGEMMVVGEETGDLSKMLLEVAAFYEKEVDQKTKNISTIIEPVLMIIVGVVVGYFAFSMIVPMYNLVETI
jgi:type IV pilus assembly protein PilC